MCGIAGYARRADLGHQQEALRRATASLAHRGPDAERIEAFETGCACIGLGHRRLSVIDLSHGADQPMHLPSGQSVVFNGEIYNFRQIRTELLALGVQFRTDSDTEVLLSAFAHWGEAALDRFVGMFAFALVDRTAGVLYLVRDRFGVKPLYYSISDGRVTFGSELRVFSHFGDVERRVDPKAVAEFLTYGYIGESRSIFAAVRKVSPGSIVRISLENFSAKERRYWEPREPFSVQRNFRSLDDAADALEEVVVEAVSLRLVSDVPVGLFLSGGYDSSLVAAVVSKSLNRGMESFTIGFREESYDESGYAEQIAAKLGLSHRELTCTPSDAQDVLRQLPDIYDEPFGDSSAIPTYLVSRLARETVTVSLSADGGDELFGGYRKYANAIRLRRISGWMPRISPKLARQFAKIIPVAMLRRVHPVATSELAAKVSVIALSSSSLAEAAEVINISTVDAQLIGRLAGAQLGHGRSLDALRVEGVLGEVNQMLAADVSGYLVSDILTKVDRASMANSLESREPLLDHRLYEFAASLPVAMKIEGGAGKRVLKHLTHRYLPKSLMDRPKMGFGIPVSSWMRGPLRAEFSRALAGEGLDVMPEHARDTLRSLVGMYFEGDDSQFMLLWYTFCYIRWSERWLAS